MSEIQIIEFMKLIKKLPEMPNVQMPTAEQLRRLSEGYGNLTEFGNYNFCSAVRNRSAGLTVYIGNEKVRQKGLTREQQEILKKWPKTMKLVARYFQKAPLYYIPLTMGHNDTFNPHCNLIISRYRADYVRLAYMVYKTLFERSDRPGPEIYLVDLPEWQEKDRQILVFPEEHLTIVLGSDYYGEIKKGFLRMGMYLAKEHNMLGLHAGAKMIWARGGDGRIKKLGMIIFGLTATGKTTHSCHHHGLLEPGEKVRIVQDDVIFLKKSGETFGTERGFYIKTEGLNPDVHPLLYKAATSKNAILENVMVDYTGKVYFDDDVLTGNGRGIIQFDDLGEWRNEEINLPPIRDLDKLIIAFITRRNTVLPIVTKLNKAQAAGAFMLGESVESSGGDPRRAGESIRVVGMNPFIVGDDADEGNWFYDFLEENENSVECYQLNTGGVGELAVTESDGTKRIVRKATRVEIHEMASIIRNICRGTIKWRKEAYFNTLVPEEVEGVDMKRFELRNYYSEEEIFALVENLKRERREYLLRFKNLYPEILEEFSF